MNKTLLHWAAKRDYYNIIQLLLENKALINARDCQGRTPLYFACKHNRENCIKV